MAAALGLVVAGMETVLARFSKGIGLDVLLVVGLSMLVCTVLGGIIGVLLPFAARRMGTDPATLSSPLITSVMDLVGVFIDSSAPNAGLIEELAGRYIVWIILIPIAPCHVLPGPPAPLRTVRKAPASPAGTALRTAMRPP